MALKVHRALAGWVDHIPCPGPYSFLSLLFFPIHVSGERGAVALPVSSTFLLPTRLASSSEQGPCCPAQEPRRGQGPFLVARGPCNNRSACSQPSPSTREPHTRSSLQLPVELPALERCPGGRSCGAAAPRKESGSRGPGPELLQLRPPRRPGRARGRGARGGAWQREGSGAGSWCDGECGRGGSQLLPWGRLGPGSCPRRGFRTGLRSQLLPGGIPDVALGGGSSCWRGAPDVALGGGSGCCPKWEDCRCCTGRKPQLLPLCPLGGGGFQMLP